MRKKSGRPILRIWQKVFIAALVFVMTAVTVAAYALSAWNLRMGLERESAAACGEHEQFISSIFTDISYERAIRGKIYISKGECDSIIRDIVENGNAHPVTAANVKSETYETFSFGDMPEIPQELSDSLGSNGTDASEGKIFYTVVRHGDEGYIVTASRISADLCKYTVYTCHDAGQLYKNYREQLKLAWIISIIISSAVSFLLLASVWFMMRPISYVNRSLKRIAGGDYSYRLKPYGGAEIYELSENVNRMAAAAEDNIEELRHIADGRKQFIDNFAHEMKTPLTSIMGFADILRIKKDVGVKQRREFAGIIVEEAKRLRGLSGKLLELATADGVKFDLADIPAKDLLAEIYTSVIPIIARRRLNLICESDDCVISADKELIKSLFYNLIDNAAKASSPEGEIRAGIKLIPDGAVLYVSDDGIGMDRSHIRRITEPFYMVDKSRSRSAGGAGLGLALCDKITKVHGGRLDIESEAGIGTTVRAVFPQSFVSVPVK